MATLGNRRRLAAAFGILVVSMGVTGAVGLSLYQFMAAGDGALTAIRRAEARSLMTVPVYAHALGIGSVLAETDLVDQRVPVHLVPEEAARDPGRLVGLTLREPVLPGEFVRPERFAIGNDGGIDAIIPNGMRAMAVNLAATAYTAGTIAPGQTVDVIVTFPADDRPMETVTLLPGTLVLAVDEWISETARGELLANSQMTLAVTTDDALRFAAALAVPGVAVKLSLQGELEYASGPMPAPVDQRVTGEGRMSIAEYRQTFKPEDIEAMFVLWEKTHEGPQKAVVNAAIVRDVVVAEAPPPELRNAPVTAPAP